MATVEPNTASGITDSGPAGGPFNPGARRNDSLARRQAMMLREISVAPSKRDALRSIAESMRTTLKGCVLTFLERSEPGRWTVAEVLIPCQSDRGSRIDGELLQSLCEDVCSTGIAKWTEVDDATASLAVPIFYQNQPPDVLHAIAANGNGESQDLESAVHFAALNLTLWDTLHRYSAAAHKAAEQHDLLALLSGLDSSLTLEEVAHRLAHELAKWSGADRAAVGISRRQGGHCRLAAISGMANLDRRSEYVRSVEETLAETEGHDSACSWVADEAAEQPEMKTYRHLAAVAKADRIVGLPLRSGRDRCVATVVMIFGRETPVNEARLTNVAKQTPSLSTTLELVQAAQVGPVQSFTRTLGSGIQNRRGRTILVALCAVALSLLVPLRYRLACDCTLEPISRRFIAAPFDGTLERTLVDPGMTVRANQALARLDGRVLQWEITGLTTDYQQAAKQRDAALAARDGAAAQLAALEMEQAQSKMQLAEFHREHLTIKSSIDGVIVRGDLERSEGAPVRVGQTLFEIAPLQRMIVEIAVPEEEIAYVKVDYPLDVRLDAFPHRVWSGKVERIHPRAEIIDQQNVFVAQVTLENEDGFLRPGMKGRAKITGEHKALGWLLFHRPIDKLAQRFGW